MRFFVFQQTKQTKWVGLVFAYTYNEAIQKAKKRWSITDNGLHVLSEYEQDAILAIKPDLRSYF